MPQALPCRCASCRIPALLLAPLLLLTACGGRPPDPVFVRQWGDAHKSCVTLKGEMDDLQYRVKGLLARVSNRFFWGMSAAEKVELAAWRGRYDHLAVIAEQQDCGAKPREAAVPGETGQRLQFEVPLSGSR